MQLVQHGKMRQGTNWQQYHLVTFHETYLKWRIVPWANNPNAGRCCLHAKVTHFYSWLNSPHFGRVDLLWLLIMILKKRIAPTRILITLGDNSAVFQRPNIKCLCFGICKLWNLACKFWIFPGCVQSGYLILDVCSARFAVGNVLISLLHKH